MKRKSPVDLSSDVWVERWDVVGTSGKPYVVAKNRNGTFGCTCQAWTMQPKERWIYDPTLHMLVRKDCQHILRKKMELMVTQGVMPRVKSTGIASEHTNTRQITLDE